MTPIERAPSVIFVYWAALLVVFTLAGMYGRQVVEWLLVKLHEFFIEHNSF